MPEEGCTLDGRWFPETGDAGPRHRVLEGGAGPSVILLHEVMGVVPSLLELAYRLIACGFTLHVPVLYGRPDGTTRGRFRGPWCLRRELRAFAVGADTPLAQWVRELVVDVGRRSDPAHKVGVIGMCMTGGLAIAALAEPGTGAAVAAQPSLPYRLLVNRAEARRDLGLSQDSLNKVRTSRSPLLAARYEIDGLCPPVRFGTLRAELGGGQSQMPVLPDGVAVESHDGLTIITVPGRGHSVFTGNNPNEPALQHLVSFLRTSLGPPAS